MTGLTLIAAFGVSLLLMSATLQARNSLTIFECTEQQTCDSEGNCVNGKSRVVLADMMTSEIATPFLSVGPLRPEAGAGLFMERDWRWILGPIPAPDGAIGRAYFLSKTSEVRMRAHVFREGREVSGLSADWVRSDFDCKQVMF